MRKPFANLPEKETAESVAARILAVQRFAPREERSGWITNGIKYPRDSVEALARLGRVIALRPKIGSCEMRIALEHDAGKKVLTIWWRGRNSPSGGWRGGRKPLPPEEKARRYQMRIEANRTRNRELRQRRKAAGQCVTCEKNLSVASSQCGACLEKRVRYKKTLAPRGKGVV